MLALVACLFLLQGCSAEEQPSTAEIYENHKLGFCVEFPSAWKGKYTVDTNPRSSSSVVVETEWGGILCYIFRKTSNEWVESGKGESIPVEYRVLGENSDYVYLLYFASDVNYDPENEEQVNTYNEMRNDLYNIKFEILKQS